MKYVKLRVIIVIASSDSVIIIHNYSPVEGEEVSGRW